MHQAVTVLIYAFAFLSVYIQVFLLISFLERRKNIILRKDTDVTQLSRYPSVTVVVPCYNESTTVVRTVHSLLALNYPKEKISIVLVDDGSTDDTWEIMQQFSAYSNIELYHKENGGKHTAMNYAIARSTSEFIGGLDADSFVHPEALLRIIKTFEDDDAIMAVAPSILVHNPKNMFEKAQNAEYQMSVYTKKTLGFLNGIHVTPGPFSIFRKKVFDDLGLYTKAHNTEDQEIALRMHASGYRIDHCPDAHVYTVSPNTIKKLYKQRLRWIYGFIKNAIDYRRLFFRKKYGAVGSFTLPSGFISVISIILLWSILLVGIVRFVVTKIDVIRTVGFHPLFHGNISFDWFFVDTKALVFLIVFLYAMAIFGLMLGRKMIKGKYSISFDVVYFLVIYRIVAPVWILKAIWNAAWSKETNWALERQVQPVRHHD